jgi:uncharacterized membrane protein YczE
MKQAINILLAILTGVFITDFVWLLPSLESYAHLIFAIMCLIGLIVNR